MFHIYCPYCEELREEEEFHPKGEAHIVRPKDPEACSDEEWGDYLFFRDNPRGIHHELWVHAVGCRKFFNVTRNTVTYEILETYKIGERPTVTAERAAGGDNQGNVQVASGGQQTVGASGAAVASVKGERA
ncbi:sarcosine oxidase subunit delta [Halomonas sp. MCCC 1A17488]|uniref:Sarcosine oxidase subunit delta n=1 Tax=Billgrantia sulfidoxydans TaxID=2733484 RepID=A0ABX7VZF2_9GAMM|nr:MULTISPECIES: sarcosine oxidase subunit delta [Halomonas]MCE8016970.1 sarcosine oxidase subunit delta [Halomonas sp. MCCC 1A17488]MCG3240303.1 sarcosine oxidase subunit delta [Halomonas sp. MCCC 1A17488]QPP49825.1 sarcosine oxidase subunit delta [Halomonas sp. SS10-MC5]QTP53435.1 sarcosine oxidase subunit delta [Halomonas sulfidoxydans]